MDKPGSNRPVARGTVQAAQLAREALAADRELPAGIDQAADQGTLAERTAQAAGPVPEILAEPLDQAVAPARRPIFNSICNRHLAVHGRH